MLDERGPRARPLRHAAAARAGPRDAGRRAGPAQHRLHQHHPARARAVVPRRLRGRAADPRVPALERRRDGLERQPQGPRGRRPHRDLPVLGQPLRGRLQPLLPRQGRPRAAATRSTSRATPPPASTPAPSSRAGSPSSSCYRFRQEVQHGPGAGPAVLPAPAADAGLLGVPDGLDGPDGPQLDLPGALQPLPAQPRHQGHLRPARLGVPRRRRDGRARVARRDPRRGPRGARQPHLGRQLQPAAARRTGHRQRQDHPGARGQLPRRRLERHQGRSGARAGTPCSPATSTASWSTR